MALARFGALCARAIGLVPAGRASPIFESVVADSLTGALEGRPEFSGNGDLLEPSFDRLR